MSNWLNRLAQTELENVPNCQLFEKHSNIVGGNTEKLNKISSTVFRAFRDSKQMFNEQSWKHFSQKFISSPPQL